MPLRCMGELRYIAPQFLTLEQMEVGGWLHTLAVLPLEKEPLLTIG
jgi:hypothetical protein